MTERRWQFRKFIKLVMLFSEPFTDSWIYKVKAMATRGETVFGEFSELVRNAQSANQAAIEMLGCHYQMPAVRVAQNIFGDLWVAEDAVLEAWLLARR